MTGSTRIAAGPAGRSRAYRRTARIGFTLVELLVVISVIALLIGLLLPALSGARDAARFVACQSNQRQIGTSVIVYTNDHDDFLPYPGNGVVEVWPVTLWRYAVGDESVGIWGDIDADAPWVGTVMHCPAAPTDATTRAYAMNQRLHNNLGGPRTVGGTTFDWARLTSVARATETGYVADSTGSSILFRTNVARLFQPQPAQPGLPVYTAGTGLEPRHLGGSVVAAQFLDGHVSALQPDTVPLTTYDHVFWDGQ